MRIFLSIYGLPGQFGNKEILQYKNYYSPKTKLKFLFSFEEHIYDVYIHHLMCFILLFQSGGILKWYSLLEDDLIEIFMKIYIL